MKQFKENPGRRSKTKNYDLIIYVYLEERKNAKKVESFNNHISLYLLDTIYKEEVETHCTKSGFWKLNNRISDLAMNITCEQQYFSWISIKPMIIFRKKTNGDNE